MNGHDGAVRLRPVPGTAHPESAMVTTTQRRMLVLGAGVVGVTTAYFLAREGNEVTLIEHHPGAGLETSFANGGLITPSMSDPWAAPGIPAKMLKWLGREDSPFLLRPGAVPGLLSWGLRFLRECNHDAWLRNTRTIYRLCSYSHDAFKALIPEAGIDFDANASGTLHLFGDQSSMQSATRVAEVLAQMGVVYRLLDAAGCAELEPTLAPHRERITGGIHYPGDDAGDAHLFTRKLAEQCAAMGVIFRYGENARSIELHGNAFAAVVTDAGRAEADACVVALGNGSAPLVRPLGIKLPIYPVKGYSVTYPVEGWNGAPTVPFVDDVKKMGIVRIGDRVRVAGTAEFTGFEKSLTPARTANLERNFLEMFPDYPDRSRGQAWTGLRPMTPDGIPYLGRTPVHGLYLNTGHGHLGWTMSCGSAKVICGLVMGHDPDLDLSGMTLDSR